MIWFVMAFSWSVIGTGFALALTAKFEDDDLRFPRSEPVVHCRRIPRESHEQ